jgi:beta-lactamase superfamily II metal-dependent hydrolase
MHIHVFQSYQGDCLLIEDAARKRRVLCDGGTPGAMLAFVAGELAAWQQRGEDIDLAYVSHIDSDHIGGIAVLLDLLVQWKVFDFHSANGDPSRQPELPRPPAIRALWHNAFRDLIKDNAGAIEGLLAASAPLLQASQVDDVVSLGREYASIATSIKEALTVSRLIKPDLLDIPLNALPANPGHGGKLIMARKGQKPERIGGLEITILCPFPHELENMRKGWNNWLRDESNRETARQVRALYAGRLESSVSSNTSAHVDLHNWQGIAPYKGVTAPNVASTVLLVREGNKTALLTGDNHPDMIVDGLEFAGLLKDGFIHLDVLKYPHHGSEHNISERFPRQVSADHYIFCGNGSNTNPELSVLKAMFAARIGPEAKHALSPKASGRPFQFWFSTSPKIQRPGKERDHMTKVVRWAEDMRQEHPDRFSYHFGATPYTTLTP